MGTKCEFPFFTPGDVEHTECTLVDATLSKKPWCSVKNADTDPGYCDLEVCPGLGFVLRSTFISITEL